LGQRHRLLPNWVEQTGQMALRVLKGEKPQAMPIEKQKGHEIVLNAKQPKPSG
jgi:putative ABC transport system substrate-binding protein